ncbi:hypothetical protein [Kamptonema sp. UHCC 0994]|uniref:hypothetical protein n=1 Tax=Kamptonema sp. UHCC 0994 TaxID=3031329 RepID=UPI0023B96402|nr:hypothetical protein [Kamptonema sp. UHCC 0994]MDF0551819.1 hypothetical protein [Kamptonema sp. UHCC 0994]
MTTNNGKFTPETKKTGDLIRSADWNAAMQEIVRLESAKVNRKGGDSLEGPLTIESALAVETNTIASVQLEVQGALKLQEGVAINQFSIDSSLSSNSDSIVPTQKAIKAYVDTVKTDLDTVTTILNTALIKHTALINYVDRVAKGTVIKGIIVMWSGKAEEIPTGWALCNGQNGTPDLRDRFIVGADEAGSTQTPKAGEYGDADQHNHSMASKSLSTSNAGQHFHAWCSEGWSNEPKSFNHEGWSVRSGYYNGSRSHITSDDGSHSHTVNFDGLTTANSTGKNRPKWYALCFIMKL